MRRALSALLGLVAVLAFAAPAQAVITDPPGLYHLKSFVGTCIDATSAPAGTPLRMWRCLNTSFEQWRPVTIPVPGTRYGYCHCYQATMFLNQAVDMCMAVQVPVSALVVQQPCDEFDEKQWWQANAQYIDSSGILAGGYVRPFADNDKYLDVRGAHTDNGTPLQVHTYTDTYAQIWGPPAGRLK